jgi:hypothetical protein
MAANPNPYDLVIADLESKRAELDKAIQLMKKLRDGDSSPVAEPVSSVVLTATPAFTLPFDIDSLPTDTFFGMTIADAAAKFLTMVGRKPQSTNAIIGALERGGIMDKKYSTVYAVLSRRAERQRDIVNVHGDWGLREWYGNSRKPRASGSVGKATAVFVSRNAESGRFQEDITAIRGIKRTGIEPPIDSDPEVD